MRIKSRCGVSFDEFDPHKTCIYAVGKPPFWKIPELGECPYLRLRDTADDRKTWECRKHKYIKTIEKEVGTIVN